MHRVETQVVINASADRVWSLLMDFQDYPRWNPFLTSIEGVAEVGQSLAVRIQPPGSNGMRFRPKVMVAEPGREFRWKGQLVVPGVFDGEHYFVLQPTGPQVVLQHGELFSGLLVPFFRRSLDGTTKQGFVAMNDALKREAEHT
jgi:hypothetical protein